MAGKTDAAYGKSRGKLLLKEDAPVIEVKEDKGFAKAGPGRGVNAYERHKQFINDYVLFFGRQEEYCKPTKPHKTDYDVIREEYRFIRTEDDNDDSQFEKRIAKKYYDKLFKEYCLADLSRYKHGQIGLRWRTEKEVFTGKGQFVCGNKKCDERGGLNSYELPFSYKEAGETKSALVKLRACPKCAEMVTYYHNKKNHKNDKPPIKQEVLEGREEPLQITGSSQSSDDKSKKRRADASIKEEDGNKKQRQTEEAEEEAVSSANPWKFKAQVEKTKEEEFEAYFEGLFP